MITQVMSVMTVQACQMVMQRLMNAVYAVVITPAVRTVPVYPMEQAGKVTAAVLQNIMMVMNVMTVQACQMETIGQVTAAVLLQITQVMTVMTVMVYQMVIAG